MRHGHLTAFSHAVVVGNGTLERLAQQMVVLFRQQFGRCGHVFQVQFQVAFHLFHGQLDHGRRITGQRFGLELVERLDHVADTVERRHTQQVVRTLGMCSSHALEGAVTRGTVRQVDNRSTLVLADVQHVHTDAAQQTLSDELAVNLVAMVVAHHGQRIARRTRCAQRRIFSFEKTLVLRCVTSHILEHILQVYVAVGHPVVVVLQQGFLLGDGQVGQFEMVGQVGIEFGKVGRVLPGIGHQLAQTFLLHLQAFVGRHRHAFGHETLRFVQFNGFHCFLVCFDGSFDGV